MGDAILNSADFSVRNVGRIIRGYRAAVSQIQNNDVAREHTFRLYDSGDRLCGYSSQAIVFPVSPDDAKRVAAFLLQLEDRRFYRHKGVDWRAIARAAVRNFQNARVVQGGSTLSMQLVRNTMIETSPSFLRKAVEVALARKMEKYFSKDEILRLYCEQVFMGGRLRGLQSASVYIHRKPLAALSDGELCGLLGLLRSPEYFTPYHSAKKYGKRRKFINRLLECEDAQNTRSPNPIRVNVAPRVRISRAAKRSVRDLANESRDLKKVGVTVRSDLQKQMDAALGEESAKQKDAGMCAVILDNNTGELLAESSWRGGKETDFSPMLEGRIQPGSTFKTFALVAAIEQGFSLDTPLLSAPFCSDYIKNAKGVPWSVRNYGGVYRGEISLLRAFVNSDNCAFARLAEMLDTDKLAETYRKFGLVDDDAAYPSIVLGATRKGVNPVRLALAYQAIARGGVIRQQCRLLRYAEFRGGEILWTSRNGRDESMVINADVAESTRYALRAAAHSYGMPLLWAKTGTTDAGRVIVAFGKKTTGVFANMQAIWSPSYQERGVSKDIPWPLRLFNKMVD